MRSGDPGPDRPSPLPRGPGPADDWFKDRANRSAGLRRAPDATARRACFEALLGAGYGECLLGRPEIAALVENALLYFDRTHDRLHASCVMPNHLHVWELSSAADKRVGPARLRGRLTGRNIRNR
jgi:hypothetical protein